LFLLQQLLGLRDVSELLTFDLVLHLGTLLALVIFTWRELVGMILEFFRWIARKPARDKTARALILPLIVGTIPGALVGLFLLKQIAEVRSIRLIGIAMLVACAYFLFAERAVQRRRAKPAQLPSVADSGWIGVAQAVAGSFAGLSRSGLTIATGMLRGLSREAAAKFSFLLSIPIILGAGLSGVIDIQKHGSPHIPAAALAVGFVSSAVFGGVAIGFLLRYLRTHTLRPFAAYLGALGLVLVVFSMFWR